MENQVERGSNLCPDCEIKMVYFQLVPSLLKIVRLSRSYEIENP